MPSFGAPELQGKGVRQCVTQEGGCETGILLLACWQLVCQNALTHSFSSKPGSRVSRSLRSKERESRDSSKNFILLSTFADTTSPTTACLSLAFFPSLRPSVCLPYEEKE